MTVSGPRQQAAGGPAGRRGRAKHVPIAGGAARPGRRRRLGPREDILVELLAELPPLGAGAVPEDGPLPGPALPAAPPLPGREAGAGAVPEDGPLLGPAPLPGRGAGAGAGGRVERGAPPAVAPRRAAGRAAEDVREVDVGPARGAGHGDGRVWVWQRGTAEQVAGAAWVCGDRKSVV